MKKIIALLISFFIFSVIAGSCVFASSLRPAYEMRNIRVAILDGVTSFNLAINGPYSLLGADNKMLFEGDYLNDAKVLIKGAIIKIGNSEFDISRIKVIPQANDAISVNARRFRGNIEIIIKKDNKFLVVNHLVVEDYVKGVLYHEVSHFWPIEAIKAQAVLARTYALYEAKVNKALDYDLKTNTASQMYGGRTSEKFRTNMAVAATKREVLTFENELFPTYYHATCAGHTEDAANLFNIKIPPLAGVTCGFCRRSPHFKWQAKVSLKDILEKLKGKGFNLGVIGDIRIKGVNASGRISQLEIEGRDKSISLSGKDFRNAVGPNLIRSTNFQVKIENGFADFIGFGWGHGAGLCQWGAYFMAKEGKRYEEIIKYYYPGAELKELEY
ncbi:MAG: SpoIID/LytB domain-containing protein [Candidatus Omnitrophota bacterium]